MAIATKREEMLLSSQSFVDEISRKREWEELVGLPFDFPAFSLLLFHFVMYINHDGRLRDPVVEYAIIRVSMCDMGEVFDILIKWCRRDMPTLLKNGRVYIAKETILKTFEIVIEKAFMDKMSANDLFDL